MNTPEHFPECDWRQTTMKSSTNKNNDCPHNFPKPENKTENQNNFSKTEYSAFFTMPANGNSNDHDVEVAYNNGNDARNDPAVLSASDDPFAPREGKTLLWTNINMTLVRTN